MPTEVVLLVFLVIGTLLLVFRKNFVEISSHFDWLLGHRFEESMKRFKEISTVIGGVFLVVFSLVELYPCLEKMIGKTLSVIIYIILMAVILYIISLAKKKQKKTNKKTLKRY